jgi:succinate dehydrogenase/fumarate reductase cytochrome b subunit (b558 family)
MLDLYRSALGKKYLMAVSGIVGLGYVLAHMLGNLKLYQSAEDFNAYAHFLRRLLYPILPESGTLNLLRLVLIAALVVHVVSAYQLTVMNRRARPERYQGPRDYVVADFAARTMRWTGVVVLLFIGYHLADLTFGWVNPAPPARRRTRRSSRASRRCRSRLLPRRQHRPRSSTSTTGCGASSSRWAGTTGASTTCAARWRSGSPWSWSAGTCRSRSPCSSGSSPEPSEGPHGTNQEHLSAPPHRRSLPMTVLDAKIPEGPIESKWDNHRFAMKLVSPANKRKFSVIVVGTGSPAPPPPRRWASSATGQGVHLP